MRRISIGCTLLALTSLVSSGAAAGAHATPPAHPVAAAKRVASGDGWPDTREGEVASGWVSAFSSGDSAMRAFLLREQDPEGLAKRSLDERMATYRENRDRFGKLMLASVVKSKPGELTVELMASDATVMEYVFTVQTRAPFKLISVGRMETRNVGHGGFGGFHH